MAIDDFTPHTTFDQRSMDDIPPEHAIGAHEAPEKCDDVGILQDAVNSMDCFAQDGFDAICTMATTALTAMEVPGTTTKETLARVLIVIRDQAQQTVDNIGRQAEEVGCAWIDLASERRAAARRSEMGVSHA